MKLLVTLDEARQAIAVKHNVPATCIDVQGTESISSNEVMSLLKQGSRLQAIKILRELYGCGLKEAKDFCDHIYPQRGY